MNKISSRSCVIIAGMHRSGTSALSRVIGLLGCTLPKNLLRANPINATGHWKSERLSSFNDEILDAAGSGWDDWATCTPDWVNSPVMGDFARRALEIYGEEFGQANLAVFEDPRICRLLPFWLPLLEEANIKPYVILPIRNPKEVAASLAKRDGSDSYYNHLLWLRHVLEAEADSRGSKRAFVTYNDLLDNYSIVVSTTQERLGLKWPRRSARISEEIEAYLSNQHRHQKLSDKSMSGDLSSSDWMRQTYEIMLRWADNGEDLADRPVLDKILADLNLSAQRFGRIVFRGKTAMSEVNAMKNVAHQTGIQIAQLNTQLANNAHEFESKSALLNATLAATETDLLALKNDLLHTQHQLNAYVINIEEKQAQLNDVEQENTQLTRQADLLYIKLDEATRAREKAESNYAQKVSELEQLNETLVKGFRDTFTLAEQDNEDLTKRLKDAETELETLEQTRRSQMFELNQVRSSLAQKKAEADDYHFEIKRYQVEKNELTQSIADLKTEIAAARAQGGKLASQIQGIVSAMDNQNNLPLIPKRFKHARNRKILSAAGVVNQEWYLKSNPDVGALGVDATLHYLTHGALEGRSPNPEHESIKHHRDDAQTKP